MGVGSSGPGPFHSWDFRAEKEYLRAAFACKILLQTNWTIQELTICVGLMQRAWIPVLLGGKTRQNYPFPSESSGFQQLALIWALIPLLALENLHLEGWLWFPEAVTHTPSKVNAAVSENGHKRTVETHYYAVNLCAGLKARRKCLKAEERVQIREENKNSERVRGSKLVWLTSVFPGPRPESSKWVRDAGNPQMVLLKSLPNLLLLVLHFTLRKSFSSSNANILWRSLGTAYLVLTHYITALWFFTENFSHLFLPIFIEV